MTRLVYTGLALDYTISATTFPSITHASGYIEDLYKQAADLQGVTYSETVPDSALLYSLIKNKVSNYCNNQRRMHDHPQNFTKDLPPLIWDTAEEEKIRNAPKRGWTVESASKNDRW